MYKIQGGLSQRSIPKITCKWFTLKALRLVTMKVGTQLSSGFILSREIARRCNQSCFRTGEVLAPEVWYMLLRYGESGYDFYE